MKYETIETTIKDILELDYHSKDRVYGLEKFTIFQPITCLDTFGLDIETEYKIIEHQYVFDKCNDGRSRDLRVIFYNNIPFALYQYMGGGFVENEVLFNKDIYEQLIKDYTFEYLEKLKIINISSIEDPYVIKNYNMAYFLKEDNKIIAKPYNN